MTLPRKIGILGGMGPEATVELMQRIIRLTSVRKDDDHIPMVVDNNPQVPSRIDALIYGTGTDPGPVLARMAGDLEASGADALVLPCNTAHHYAASITGQVKIPFLNMVELTCAEIAAATGTGRVIGILASPAVRFSGVFARQLAKVGLTAIYPKDESSLLQLVQDIKSSGPTQTSRNRFANFAAELRDCGADGLIVGCSEFSLIADEANTSVPVVDSLDVLARAAHKFATAQQIPIEKACP